MQIHITNLTNLKGTATIAQRSVTEVAEGMGMKALNIFYYKLAPDYMNELPYRLNGTLAPVSDGDIVVFQYPSWIGVNYDETFVKKVKSYNNSKLIIFVQDIQQMMFNSEKWILDYEVSVLNYADVIILPSQKMYDVLLGIGLRKDIPVVFQTVWEMVGMKQIVSHKKKRQIFFPGDTTRFSFLNDYHGRTTINVFQKESPERANDESFHYAGFMNSEELNERLSEGGFGLVWANDDYFDRYYSMNQPHKLGNMLSCGIPVIVRKGCTHEEFIKKYGLGFVVSSIDEADDIVQNLSDEQFDVLYNNVRNIQSLMLNGYFTRMVLQEAIIQALSTDCEQVDYEKVVRVIDNNESIDYILANRCSVSRFGDGEFDIIAGRGIPYQDYNMELADELRKIAAIQSGNKFMVCMPDVFEHIDRYNDFCKDFWRTFINNNKELINSVCLAPWYGSTNLSRPYMDLADKSNVGDYFDKLRKLWDERDILIVEGSTSRSGVGNDLFGNAKSIKRIIGPSKNAYSRINDLESEIRNYGKNRLILLMLGPTAKVISYHLSQENYWLIDLGHIDSEYEWYKLGATEKVKLPNKHTAEHNYDENIIFDNDEEYYQQIVSRVESRRK